MAETSVIREFLVLLGYKQDEAALKNFAGGIEKASKAVFGLAAAVEGTAVLVAAGVARFASNLEALYFASIRTGSSAASLKAFDRAAQDFGASAGEALSSVEGLSHALRENPFGTEGLLRTMGVQTRDANGRLRETRDLLMQTHTWFAAMPTNVGLARAGALGVTENTYLALRNGDFLADYQKKLKELGPGWQKTVEDAHAFMENVRDLQTVIEAFGLKIEDALQKKLGVSVKSVTQWLQRNGPLLATRIAEVIVKVIDVAERVGRAIGWLIDLFIKWDKATDGWSTRILGILAVLKFFGGAQILGAMLALTNTFLRLGGGIATAAASGNVLLGILGRLTAYGAALGVGYAIGSWINSQIPQEYKDALGETLAQIGTGLGIGSSQEAYATNNPLHYLMDRGRWTQEQAAGILANLQAESGMNPAAVGDHGHAYGLAQWHEDRQADFAKWAGHDIHQSTAAEQLDFIDYELFQGKHRAAGMLMRAAQKREQMAQVMSNRYEMPAGGQAEADRRAASAVHVSSQTTVHVNGSSDPHATGQAVASQQRRVNQDLTRSFVAVVQ